MRRRARPPPASPRRAGSCRWLCAAAVSVAPASTKLAPRGHVHGVEVARWRGAAARCREVFAHEIEPRFARRVLQFRDRGAREPRRSPSPASSASGAPELPRIAFNAVASSESDLRNERAAVCMASPVPPAEAMRCCRPSSSARRARHQCAALRARAGKLARPARCGGRARMRSCTVRAVASGGGRVVEIVIDGRGRARRPRRRRIRSPMGGRPAGIRLPRDRRPRASPSPRSARRACGSCSLCMLCSDCTARRVFSVATPWPMRITAATAASARARRAPIPSAAAQACAARTGAAGKVGSSASEEFAA